MILCQEESEKKRNHSASYQGDSSLLLQTNLKLGSEKMAYDEIEKLLGSTDFDDQLDANNIKLHRALLLQ